MEVDLSQFKLGFGIPLLRSLAILLHTLRGISSQPVVLTVSFTQLRLGRCVILVSIFTTAVAGITGVKEKQSREDQKFDSENHGIMVDSAMYQDELFFVSIFYFA
jgi:hypothetical protein